VSVKMRTSRALVLTKAKTLEMDEFPFPKLTADDAMLKVERCGICGSDVEQYDGALESIGYSGPMIPGHEPLGTIEAIGEKAAERWKVGVGDRVVVEPYIPCLACNACRRGETTNCTGSHLTSKLIASYGMISTDIKPHLFGAYSEYMYLHPNSVLHRVPKTLHPDIAVLFNPLAAGIGWGYEESNLRMGDTIVIFGSGQRGLACVIAARAAGAGRIIVTDMSRSVAKLELAREFGAHATIVADQEDVVARVTELTGGQLADVVVDTTPYATQPFLDALAVIRRGGTVVLPGVKGGRTVSEFNTDLLIIKAIKLRGALGVRSSAYREAIRLLTIGGLPYEKLHSASYSLDQAEKAILHLAGRIEAPLAISLTIAPHLS
jgi:threonine dehydrogenase-like Zn-dependent dehydrogenase